MIPIETLQERKGFTVVHGHYEGKSCYRGAGGCYWAPNLRTRLMDIIRRRTTYPIVPRMMWVGKDQPSLIDARNGDIWDAR